MFDIFLDLKQPLAHFAHTADQVNIPKTIHVWADNYNPLSLNLPA